MFKILMMVLAFVKELFINHKNEFNILHHQFSFRKSLKFLVVILSFVLNYFLIHALVNVTNKYNNLTEHPIKGNPDSHTELVSILHEEIHACQQQVIDISVTLALCKDKKDELKKDHLNK